MLVIDNLINLINDRKKRQEFLKEYRKTIKHIKIAMIYRMNNDVRKKIYEYYNIDPPAPYIDTIEKGRAPVILIEHDYIENAANKLAIEQIINFAKYHDVPVNDLITEKKRLERDLIIKYFGKDKEPPEIPEELNEPETSEPKREIEKVYLVINEFKPTKRYSKEEKYHQELLGWIRAKLPNEKIESDSGDYYIGRPDIIINEYIAIEIKGPTHYKDLKTIYYKHFQYPKKYTNLIVVLFDLQVSNEKYSSWASDIKRYWPKTKIFIINPPIPTKTINSPNIQDQNKSKIHEKPPISRPTQKYKEKRINFRSNNKRKKNYSYSKRR